MDTVHVLLVSGSLRGASTNSALRARLGEADAVLFCTPEDAGALPGSF